ncbi:Pentatricopeptide repeat-containing protein [Cardamine amara subsp. amara]|uniref:Pentatricopeptide repeat-containing protein n=1 Tax=Cardamine amara subsp. amara TaxID=228776 RepID=A0ABD1AT34_CARAN
MSVLVRLTSKIASLAKSGRITSARQVFDEMPERDTVAWNTMLTSYSHLGLHQEAISIFTHLRFSDAEPDDYSFTSILSTCASLGDVRLGRKIQSLLIRSGYGAALPVNNSLINMYGKCSDTLSANKVFRDMCNDSRNEVTWCSLLFAYMTAEQFEAALDVFVEMPKRVDFAWNIMISGHAQCGKIESCLSLFREMLESEFESDCYTFSSLMNACSDTLNLVFGRMVHAVMVKSGWDSAVEAKNSVLSFYAKLGCKDDAMRELESIDVLTQVSWNSIIDACMKIGETDKALEVFHVAPEKNIVTWTTMIAGYGRNGDGEQALRFFVEMMKSGVDSDHFAYGAVLHACSGLALLGHGKMIHGCLIHRGFRGYAYVGNALVNLYAKCGDINESNRAFGDIGNKDLVSWNTMLFAFGIHGLADQALKLYDNMIASGTKPDNVTFICLLTTCSHSGLVEEGCMIFKSMVKDYGIPLEVDHVTCMIDMFGRSGHLAEAKDLATTYNSLIANHSNSSSWEALLGACAAHWQTELGREVSKVLNIAKPSEEMSFVLLSNLYCSSGRWKEAEDVRREMVERGVKKTPGCSWIEVGNQVATFVVGDCSHPRVEELCATLNCLQHEMRNPETFWTLRI